MYERMSGYVLSGTADIGTGSQRSGALRGRKQKAPGSSQGEYDVGRPGLGQVCRPSGGDVPDAGRGNLCLQDLRIQTSPMPRISCPF